MRFISKALPLFACGLMLVVSVAAQDKGQPPAPSSSCSRDTALEIIQQQIDATRTFDNGVQRITILVRAADLLWPVRESKARGAFTEAFDLAVQHFKEKGDETSREGKTMLLSWPDQRYEVIGAIAKHDTAWARKLTDQMLKEQQREAEETPIKDIQHDAKTAGNLLVTAMSLLAA